jgi:hypothetical protein
MSTLASRPAVSTLDGRRLYLKLWTALRVHASCANPPLRYTAFKALDDHSLQAVKRTNLVQNLALGRLRRTTELTRTIPRRVYPLNR